MSTSFFLSAGAGMVGQFGAPAPGYTYTNPEAAALAGRFTTPPNDTRAALIDNLVGSLKSAGSWSKMDALYVMAAANAQAAQRNWIADIYNLSEVSGPVFSADRGYTPDGLASYLDNGFNPATATSPKFTLNDAHFGAWHLTDLANAGGTSFDVGNGNSRFVNSASLQTGMRPNNVTTVSVADNYAKHKLWTRSAAAVWEYYNSGVDTGGGVDASTALTSATFNIGRTGAGSMGVNQVAIFHHGSNLTSAEAAATYAALNTYMIAVGAA